MNSDFANSFAKFILTSRSQNRFWLQTFRVNQVPNSFWLREVRMNSGFAKSKWILASRILFGWHLVDSESLQPESILTSRSQNEFTKEFAKSEFILTSLDCAARIHSDFMNSLVNLPLLVVLLLYASLSHNTSFIWAQQHLLRKLFLWKYFPTFLAQANLYSCFRARGLNSAIFLYLVNFKNLDWEIYNSSHLLPSDSNCIVY